STDALVVEVFVMDTSGWIEYFRKSEVGEEIRRLVIDGGIVTPTIVLGELLLSRHPPIQSVSTFGPTITCDNLKCEKGYRTKASNEAPQI
ncbi:MAG: hypothetical protein V3U09_05025, partial [Thermoplasmata archaeon]